MLQTLDVNRLHLILEKIYSGEQIERGRGRSTAILSLLLGNAELASPNSLNVVVCRDWNSASYFADRFFDLIESEEFESVSRKSRTVLQVNEILFRFVPVTHDLTQFVNSDSSTVEIYFDEIFIKVN